MISLVSAWIVDEFDPKLAPWLATCKDALYPVRRQLERERRLKDAIVGLALIELKTHFERNVQIFAASVMWHGTEGLADDDMRPELAAVRVVRDMHHMIADRLSPDLVANLRLVRDLAAEVERADPERSVVADFMMRDWRAFRRMCDPRNWA